ncbi:MAG: acetylglutamate kinase [Spirochaetia bacterium]|jgi:acetylglutamate kinase|nr:acetylglutamate kinase [Spirochaetia bacterium]
MQRYIDKINTLTESFPYIREFYGKTIVIKYGGHAMKDERLINSFARDVALLKLVGITPVIVHGGGPQIGTLVERLGKKNEFAGGMRVTDEETMEIVEMVLSGKVNKEIVNNINQAGCRAAGLSGKDGLLMTAEKILVDDNGKMRDIGFVGTVINVNPLILQVLQNSDFIPVIAPVAVDKNGVTFNINADTASGKISEALQAEKLILLTDVEGIKIDGKLLSTVTKTSAEKYIAQGEISGGMIPKVNCCLEALKNGVGKTHIIDGRIEHAVLIEIFTDAGIGTEIVDG